MMNGIYGVHIQGIYCEVRFENDRIIDGYIDYYNSEIGMTDGMLCLLENKKLNYKKINHES